MFTNSMKRTHRIQLEYLSIFILFKVLILLNDEIVEPEIGGRRKYCPLSMYIQLSLA